MTQSGQGGGSSQKPTRLDPIIVDGSHGIELPDGSYIGLGHSTEFEGVFVEKLDAGNNIVESQNLTYDEYEDYRNRHPEYGLPPIPPPKVRAPGRNGNGNTLGRVVGESGQSSVPASEANPPLEMETPAEASTGTKVLDGLQVGLDVVGLIPVVGEAADFLNGVVSLSRGNYVEAGLSFAAMVPFFGYAATTAKAGRKVAQSTTVATEGAAKATRQTGKRQADDTGGGKGKGRKERKDRCQLLPYKPDKCPKNQTGHHVVPDRVFRLGTRTGPGRRQIENSSAGIKGLSEAEGLVICVRGKNLKKTEPHGKIHALYDKAEEAIGLMGTPTGTAKLEDLEWLGANTVAQHTKCNALDLKMQLRKYHSEKGMGPDFLVRADPRGRFTRKMNEKRMGETGLGDF